MQKLSLPANASAAMMVARQDQPGYISGETLCDTEHPGDCIIISRWENVEDWDNWVHSQERAAFDKKIETLTGEKAEYHIYSPMVP
jgi:heme-degrading monooxygenase HmoA